MVVCFIGHRKIKKTIYLVDNLQKTIIMLINQGVTIFLFGSKSEFDILAWEVVAELKTEYPFIKRVYVRSNFQYIDASYEQYLSKFYEETYFPSKLENAGRYAYGERNYEMINKSTYCVFYYNSDYIPPLKSSNKNNLSLLKEKNSGTKIAYEYAVKKKKNIINLF